MTTRVRTLAIILAVVAALVAAFVWWFDWNMLKPYAERKVTELTGRTFRINGDLDVDLSLHPLIKADGLTLANADWSSRQPMLAVDQVAFRIDLWHLLRGQIDLPEVTVRQPKVVLEKTADGKRNWIFDRKQQANPSARPPHIGLVRLDRGTLSFDDAKPDTHIELELSTQSGTAAPAAKPADTRAPAGKPADTPAPAGNPADTLAPAAKPADTSAPATNASQAAAAERLPTTFAARGKLKGLRFSAKGRSSDVISLADASKPFAIDGTAQAGTTHAVVKGTITGIAVLAAMDLDLELSGSDLSALYPVLGVALIPSPPYKLSGRLVRKGSQWQFGGFKGAVGDSDLGGDVVFDTGGERPRLSGDLVSRRLDLRDLEGFVGARRAPEPEDAPAEKAAKRASAAEQADRVLPDKAFNVERLRAMDADIRFTGQSIRNKTMPVEKLSAHIKVDDGVMSLDPLDFGVAGGTIASAIKVDARKDLPSGSARASFKRLQLPKLFPTIDLTRTSVGSLGGQLQLTGHGKSVGGLLGTADGRFALAISSGEISNELLEIIGLDGGEIMKFLFEGDRNVPLRCAVADFSVRNGVMASDTFVVDTTDTIVRGEGSISLVDETLALTFSPVPKDASIFSVRSPIHLDGTFKHPKIRPDKALGVRIGAAVLLGALVNPLAALIPLIETGPGKDANCGALLGSVSKATDAAGKAPDPARKAPGPARKAPGPAGKAPGAAGKATDAAGKAAPQQR